MELHSPTERVIKIVDYISSRNDQGVTLSEIYKSLYIPKTTVFNIVNTLVTSGIVEEIGTDVKRFRLGFQAFVIAKRYVEKMSVIDIAQGILEEVSNLTSLTAFIAKQDKGRVFYIHKYEPANAIKTIANIGSSNYVHSTSLGKAYLMTLDDDELRKTLDMLDYKRITSKTITCKDELYKDILSSKQRGYAIDDEENVDGLMCFGAPLYNQLGEYEASISISGLFKANGSSELYGKLIKQAAEKISGQLGYR